MLWYGQREDRGDDRPSQGRRRAELTGASGTSAAIDVASAEVIRAERIRYDVAAYADALAADDERRWSHAPRSNAGIADDTDWAALEGGGGWRRRRVADGVGGEPRPHPAARPRSATSRDRTAASRGHARGVRRAGHSRSIANLPGVGTPPPTSMRSAVPVIGPMAAPGRPGRDAPYTDVGRSPRGRGTGRQLLRPPPAPRGAVAVAVPRRAQHRGDGLGGGWAAAPARLSSRRTRAGTCAHRAAR